jgi:hypothetical protein
MRAVLEDAIHCLAAETGPASERSRLAAIARAWVVADDRQWPFSFANLCDALGFSVEKLRARLLARAPTLSLDADDAAAEVAVVGRSRRGVPAGREQDVNDMIRAGHRLCEVAERLGITMSKASVLSAALSSRLKAERDQKIRGLRREGATLGAIASHYGLSCVRVSRICARRDPTDGDRTAA